MAVNRRQVFARLAVDVQLDRHRPASAALDHAQRDRLLGGRDRMDGAVGRRAVGTSAFDLGDRDHPAAGGAGEVETGFRVRGVLDQDLAGGKLRQLVVVALLPGIVRVDQPRGGGDHLPKIELDSFEQPVLVQVWPEDFTLREHQAGLAPRPPAQREIGDVPAEMADDHDRAGCRLESQPR